MGKERVVFEVGDYVRWTSQSQGFAAGGEGEIVCVVPAGNRPDVALLKAHYPEFNTAPMKKPGLSREHDSYIVRVPSVSKGKDKLYWPRVSGLELVPEF